MGSRGNNPTIDHTGLKDYSSENLHLLLETIEGINRTVELKSLLVESMEAVRLVMDAEASSLMLVDEGTGELYISLPTGPAKNEIQGKRIPKNEGIGGWVVKTKRPYLSNDLEESEYFWQELADDFKTRNIICVPLIDRENRAFGVLQALNRRKGGEFTPHDIPVFQALASNVSLAIQRTRQQEELQNRLQQKEILLTEIHHRIKNNLATISALIDMELESVEDSHAKDVLKSTYSRIQSMTEVHDLLCKKDLYDDIELGTYFKKLINKISGTLSEPGQQVDIQLKADDIAIASDRAMLCGLILNELLVNIYKHAYKDMDMNNGHVLVALSLKDDIVRLTVQDNGIGVPVDFSLEDKSSIGTWVINVIARKLGAEVQIERTGGTKFIIEFSIGDTN